MPQARKTEVRARAIEQREWPRLVRTSYPDTVRDLVAKMHQFVRGKEAREFGRADVADLDAAVLDHVGVRDLACRASHGNADVVIAGEMLELVDEIVTEEFGPRDARRIGAGLVEPCESPGRRSRRHLAAVFDPQFRVGECAFLARARVGHAAILDIAGKGLAKVAHGFIVNRR
jgi:hypothetical protein